MNVTDRIRTWVSERVAPKAINESMSVPAQLIPFIEILASIRFGIFYAYGKVIHHSCYGVETSFGLNEDRWTAWIQQSAATVIITKMGGS
jgi:hypothetical protein